MRRKFISRPIGILALTLLACAFSLAQGTTSRVTGVVTDNSGAAVSGATVTLTDEGTNTSVTTQTSESGTYTFDLIQPGKYTIAVEKQGFKKFVSSGNTALINQPTTVNAALQIGDVSATVNVENAADVVQTSSSGNLGSTVEQRTLESLPIVGLRGRNPLDLLNFQPGVVTGGNTGGAVNVNGSRDRAFNFTLDGIDINESTAGGSNFTPLRPNPDSVQEFQIVTSNFTAELGRNSGGQVTLVTRSGTNEFHGNVFEYYQTPRFNAESYPAGIAKAPKDQFVQHIFGGTFGGPLFNPGFGEDTKPFHLFKDKAFFFVNLQMLRAYDTALVTRTVYTQTARTGLFRYVVGRANAPSGSSNAAVDASGNPVLPACSGTVTTLCLKTYNIAPFGLDPSLMSVINAEPLPNDFSFGDGLNTAGFDWASPQHEKQYDLSTKFDFKPNQKNAFYVRWAQGNQNSLGDSANGGRPIFPGNPDFVDTFRSPKNLAINWRWSPTATIANEFIFGWSKYFFKFETPFPDPTLPYQFLTIATPNTNFTYNARGVKEEQYIDNLTIIHGSHTIKTGGNFRFYHHKDDRSNVAGFAIEPTVTFSGQNVSGSAPYSIPAAGSSSINNTDRNLLINTIANVLGLVGNVNQSFVSDPSNTSSFAPADTRWLSTANYPELDSYVQDNWRMRQNFVVDIGVRWEVKLHPSLEARTVLVPNQSIGLGGTPSNTVRWVPGDIFKNDLHKFEPSIGFAWDPFKSGKTSVRVNYRMASDRIATFLFGSNIFQSLPGNNVGVQNSTFGQNGGLYQNVGPVIAALFPSQTPDQLRQPVQFSTTSLNVVDPNLTFPQVHEWSAGFQREIWKNNVIEVNYIGKHAVHLLGGYNANQAVLNTSIAGISDGHGTNFLDAFNFLRDNPAGTSQYINLIMTGNPLNNGGTTRFRSLNSTPLGHGPGTGGVGTAALTISQRTCQSAEVSAGVCTNGHLNQRLLDLSGFSTLLQPFPQYTGGLNVFDSNDYSWYHGLQVIFRRRITNGLGFQFAYTLSKSKDTRSWDPSLSTVSTGSTQSASSTPQNNLDRSLNYSWSDFDRRHVFQGTWVWELPVGRGKWLSPGAGVGNYILGGWQLSGTVLWESGRPFSVYSGANTFSSVVQSFANCTGCTRDMGKLIVESGKNFWFDSTQRAMFSPPDPGTLGNLPRNFFLAPPYFAVNASLLKKFRINERVSLDARLDATNLTNHPSFDNPTAVINSSIFGRINDSVTSSPRRMQASLKLNF